MKIPIDLSWEKRGCSFFSTVLDWILFILAGINDILESLDEFEIWPDLTTGHRVSCPLGSEKLMILLVLVSYLSDPF